MTIRPAHFLVGCLFALASCTSDGQKRAIAPRTKAPSVDNRDEVLFEDPMLENWQTNCSTVVLM